MLTGNKGEWSEIYVLLRLLAEGRIYAADEQIHRDPDIYFPILKIFRSKGWQSSHNVEYEIPEHIKSIKIYLDKNYIGTFDRDQLGQEADTLYNHIIQQRSRSFASEQTEAVMNKLYTDKLKAPSSDKKDISMQVHDVWTGYNPVCGFSIKSELGSAPTLLNSSKKTNFVYSISTSSSSINFPNMHRTVVLDDAIKEVNCINSTKKVKDRMEYLKSHQLNPACYCMESMTFERNLMMIDSCFPKIMGVALYYYYFFDDCTTCREIVDKLEKENPLKYKSTGLYEYKFKTFLRSVALGMVPSVAWNGKDEANGGYIIVTEQGDVLAYYIYNRDSFEKYLLNNTKFETGSTSKHDFAYLYRADDGNVYMKLNLAIRFI